MRALQWIGVALVAVSAFSTTFHLCAYPVCTSGARGFVAEIDVGLREVPARSLAGAIGAAVQGPERTRPLWEVRRWYPWYLAGLWALALALSAAVGARRAVGAGLLLLTCALVVFEAAYLKAEYLAFLPGPLARAETVAAWLLVVGILLYRRRADRRLGAVEALVASQALLGFVHGLTLPATQARQWLVDRDPGVVLEAVLRNYPAPFWLGMAGLLMAAMPVYLRRAPRAAPEPRLREQAG